MSEFNYDLLSEVIFTNDIAFTDIDIEKAKMMLCICKNAKNNKNIQISFDKAKVYTYFKQIRAISIKKGRKMVYKWDAEDKDKEAEIAKLPKDIQDKIKNIAKEALSKKKCYECKTIKK